MQLQGSNISVSSNMGIQGSRNFEGGGNYKMVLISEKWVWVTDRGWVRAGRGSAPSRPRDARKLLVAISRSKCNLTYELEEPKGPGHVSRWTPPPPPPPPPVSATGPHCLVFILRLDDKFCFRTVITAHLLRRVKNSQYPFQQIPILENEYKLRLVV